MYVRKKRGIRRKVSEKAKRRLLRAASNQITSASELKRSMELNISVRRVQQVLQASTIPTVQKDENCTLGD